MTPKEQDREVECIKAATRFIRAFMLPMNKGLRQSTATKLYHELFLWRPIDTAPLQGKFDVKCVSGYIPPNDIMIARVHRDPAFRGERFLLPGDDDLNDMGWKPTHWRPCLEIDE